MDISTLLKNTRERKNLTQAELAKRSGVCQSNISRIEKGDCSANVSTLMALTEGLGCKLVIDFKEVGEEASH